MTARLLALAATLGGCFACTDWPQPRILRVTPSTMTETDATLLDIEVDAVLETIADYEQGTLSARTRIEIEIGPEVVGPKSYAPGGLIQAQVPTILPQGVYDVRVKFVDDGRVAVARDALTVLPGAWPDRYTIDPIGPQRRQTPFEIVVRAQGENAATFQGNVRLRVGPYGGIGPAVSRAFVDGVLTETVVVESVGASEVITVTDVAGHSGTSNAFSLQ